MPPDESLIHLAHACAGDPVEPGPCGPWECHSIEPVSQQLRIANRPGLACQDEEDGLKRVFRVVLVPHESVRKTQDHGPMSPHQAGEGRSLAASRVVVNRSRSCRSVSPATEPPLKSDSICRTTAGDAPRVMPRAPAQWLQSSPPTARTPAPAHPLATYCPDVGYRIPSCVPNRPITRPSPAISPNGPTRKTTRLLAGAARHKQLIALASGRRGMGRGRPEAVSVIEPAVRRSRNRPGRRSPPA